MSKAGWSARRPSDTRPGPSQPLAAPGAPCGRLRGGERKSLPTPLSSAGRGFSYFSREQGPRWLPAQPWAVPGLEGSLGWKTHLLDRKVSSNVALLQRVSFRLEGTPGPLPTIPAPRRPEAEALLATRTPDYTSQNARDE